MPTYKLTPVEFVFPTRDNIFYEATNKMVDEDRKQHPFGIGIVHDFSIHRRFGTSHVTEVYAQFTTQNPLNPETIHAIEQEYNLRIEEIKKK